MSDDARPAWTFKEMSEAEFRSIHSFGMVVSVKGRWEFTGADTSREWLEATNSNGKTITLPSGWKRVLDFVGYSSVPGLFKLNYLGDRMQAALEAIDKWEAKNKRDRAEFDRLRKKFAALCSKRTKLRGGQKMTPQDVWRQAFSTHVFDSEKVLEKLWRRADVTGCTVSASRYFFLNRSGVRVAEGLRHG